MHTFCLLCALPLSGRIRPTHCISSFCPSVRLFAVTRQRKFIGSSSPVEMFPVLQGISGTILS